MFFIGSANAEVITVNTSLGDKVNNDGPCSLREAMENVRFQNQTNPDCEDAGLSDPDIILFVGVPSITLASGSGMTFDGDLTIQGPITIDNGGQATKIIDMSAVGNSLTLNGVTLTNSGATAVHVGDGDLYANGCEFSNNTASNGAAIYASGNGDITIIGSSFLNNDATSWGGAINKGTNAQLFVTASAFEFNNAERGGAIYVVDTEAAEMVVLDLCTFQGNSSDGTTSPDGGGAIYVAGGGANAVISIIGCLFGGPGPLGNTAELRGGAVYTQATEGFINTVPTDLLSGGIINCDFTNNTANGPADDTGLGGAIFNMGSLHVLNSVFDSNTSTNSGGGAIGDNQMLSSAMLTVSNCTFNGNSAGTDGGAINVYRSTGDIRLYNSTLSGNTAAGVGREIAANNIADIELFNTIIADSANGANCSATGDFTDLGGNLLFSGDNTDSCGLTSGGDPELGALTLNPGPLILSRTMELGGTSAALGIGTPATCGAWPVLSIDGRGMVRPSACDAGAYEGGDTGRLVINEIDYDQGATDDHEFIEIYNAGTAAVDLDNFSLHLIDGDGKGATEYGGTGIDLPAFSLAAGGFYVICGQTNVDLPPAHCDLDVTPDTDLIEDGDVPLNDNPDAVALRLSGVIVDAVSYEGDTAAPYVEGSGDNLEDNPAEAFFSISRATDGVDNDTNNVDFVGRCNSPGLTNLWNVATTGCLVVPVELQSFVIE